MKQSPHLVPEEVRRRLSLLFQDADDAVLTKTCELLGASGLSPEDPSFLLMAIILYTQLTLSPIPKELEQLVKEMKVHLVTLQSLTMGKLQECREVSVDIKVAASRLSKQLAVYHASGASSPLMALQWAFFGAAIGGSLVAIVAALF